MTHKSMFRSISVLPNARSIRIPDDWLHHIARRDSFQRRSFLFSFLIFLGETPNSCFALFGSFANVRLFDTKSAPRIYRQHFDLESRNFMGTFDIVYSNTGYDIIIYFQSEVIGGKQSILPRLTASGGISSWEQLKLGSWNFTCLSKTSIFGSAAKCY